MIRFEDVEKRLPVLETKYWRKVFNNNLMIGTEIEQMFDNNNIGTSSVREMLSPLGIRGGITRFESPVSSVTSDGSLRNGAEIITPGRKVYGFMEQFSMYQAIYNCLKDNGAIIDSRCGWHNHIVLQDYGSNALERNFIPRIIFDNFMLIVQHYYPALAFMSATLSDTNVYTRYDHFNETYPLRMYSKNDSVSDIEDNFENRYNAVNLNPMSFNKNNLGNFHVEFRFPDGTLFPIQMASLNILFKSIILKAIELSKYGVIKFSTATDDLYKFKNSGDSDDRTSYPVEPSVIEELKALSKDLVNFLKPEIISIDNIAVPMLEHLAEEPITLMFKRLNTKDLRVVNDKLEEMLDVEFKKPNAQILPLMQIIETGVIRNTETVEEWYDKASSMVSYKEPMEQIIKEIKEIQNLDFNTELGFYFK